MDEKPTEDYSDIGGLDKQIQELVEAVVLPVTHKERFEKLGIKPPKGVLLYGPPGTGTLSASWLIKLGILHKLAAHSFHVYVSPRSFPPSPYLPVLQCFFVSSYTYTHTAHSQQNTGCC